ncbi:hypothetical protein BDB00DRAFT_473221 [Zychaea mexicana]|uniref:uncharacterized protein n=1 Tax=Zychaea mexicana TaxID=64656 RepID=UPI0022FEDFED|nr:uncharacterized protein BDB00DRAFT_473221 [Zychaea mexicana]KAI9491808.1 hypothetical protein BDB00DRAFT_473221 [Zychaea mexicana]
MFFEIIFALFTLLAAIRFMAQNLTLCLELIIATVIVALFFSPFYYALINSPLAAYFPPLCDPIDPPTPRSSNSQNISSPRTIAGLSPPVVAGLSPPAVAGLSSPVVPDLSSPVVPDLSSPVVAGLSPPVVADLSPHTTADLSPAIADLAPHIIVDLSPTIADLFPPTIADLSPPTIADLSPPTIADLSPPTIADLSPLTFADSPSVTIEKDAVEELADLFGNLDVADDHAQVLAATNSHIERFCTERRECLRREVLVYNLYKRFFS